MLPREIVILLAIAQATEFGGKMLSHSTGNTTCEYVDQLYDSLVRRGYLTRDSLGGYELTSRGGKVLVEFLHKNETRLKDTIKTLRQLRIGNNQEIDVLEMELIKAK